MTATEPTKAAKPRPRNPLFDALAILDCPDLRQLTNPGRVAKALKIIRTVAPDVTPEEIARRADNFRRHFPGATITSTAVANHWGRCDAEPPIPLQPSERRNLEVRLSRLTQMVAVATGQSREELNQEIARIRRRIGG